MGEAESFEGETFANGRATAADDHAGAANSGPAGPAAESGDGELAGLSPAMRLKSSMARV